MYYVSFRDTLQSLPKDSLLRGASADIKTNSESEKELEELQSYKMKEEEESVEIESGNLKDAEDESEEQLARIVTDLTEKVRGAYNSYGQL